VDDNVDQLTAASAVLLLQVTMYPLLLLLQVITLRLLQESCSSQTWHSWPITLLTSCTTHPHTLVKSTAMMRLLLSRPSPSAHL